MGKRKRPEQDGSPEKTQSISAPSFLISGAVLDPALTSLFATSAGPVTAPILPKRSKLRAIHEVKDASTSPADDEPGDNEDATSSSGSNSPNEDASSSKNVPTSRKRKWKADPEDIEGAYMRRLVMEEAAEEKKREAERKDSDLASINVTALPSTDAGSATEEDEDASNPQHEALATANSVSDETKSARTVFLGNVSTQAIKSKSAKKILLAYLSRPLKRLKVHNPPHKIESIRFRSTAFDVTVGPKKAAFAKKELMDSTTKSTNAYVVYSTELAAVRAAAALNGSVVLDRHLRADSFANPSKIDHRRCVFVGNLGFVNEETAEENSDEEKPKRKRPKEPADVEEGLWRVFGKVGIVDSVRVVRDKSTRIGKGVAYVQFKDENAVDPALLYNDKKFPPLLPRKLRVSRARKTRQNDSAVKGRGGAAGAKRRSKQLGRTPSLKRPQVIPKSSSTAPKRLEGIVFEGYRASSSDGKPRLQTRGKGDAKNKKGKPTTRSSRRGTAFRVGGKMKARERK